MSNENLLEQSAHILIEKHKSDNNLGKLFIVVFTDCLQASI